MFFLGVWILVICNTLVIKYFWVIRIQAMCIVLKKVYQKVNKMDVYKLIREGERRALKAYFSGEPLKQICRRYGYRRGSLRREMRRIDRAKCG